MAGKVLNIKLFSPLKLDHGLAGKSHAICHYSCNFPLGNIVRPSFFPDLSLQTKAAGIGFLRKSNIAQSCNRAMFIFQDRFKNVAAIIGYKILLNLHS